MAEKQLILSLLVSADRTSFSQLASVFAENDIEILWAESGIRAISMIQERSFDIVIADESLPDMSGLALAKKIILKNPILNLAVVSALSSRDFHEAGEGLGILMQLPLVPTTSDAEKLMAQLNRILRLTKETPQIKQGEILNESRGHIQR